MKPILFYHAPCPDGFGAAYAFWRKYGDDIEYHPLGHGEILPNVSEREVFFADIALDRETTLNVAKRASSITILDHHISKYEELKDLSYYTFDNDHSGAMVSWMHLFPDEEPPALIKYVEDRDIWKWEFEESKKVLAALDSIPYDFEEWDRFNTMLEMDPEYILLKGTAILEYCETLMEKIIQDAHTIKIRGIEVPAVNTPFFRSEILNRLCLDHPFAAGYHYDGEHFVFSLRSTDEGLDVAEVASSFPGGGGHRNASGFRVKSLNQLSNPPHEDFSWMKKLFSIMKF